MDKIVEKVIWDSDFFNLNIYKINTRINNQEEAELFNEIMKRDSIDLYYYTLDSKYQETINLLEYNHYFLMQAKTRLELNLSDYNKYKSKETSKKVKIFNDSEFNINDLYKLSKQVYKQSRFYNDKNIDNVKVEELYRIWIYNSYYKGFADNIYLYTDKKEIYGFCITKTEEKNNLRITLTSIDEKQRGKSIASTLLSKIIDDYKEKNYKKCLSTPQLSNIGALNYYIKNGFRFYQSEFIFHKWNNKKGDSSHENSF